MSFVNDENPTWVIELFIKYRTLEKEQRGKATIMGKTDKSKGKCRCWTNDKDTKTGHIHSSNFLESEW